MAWLADNPRLLAELHPTKNDDLGFAPELLRARSNRYVWWRCAAGADHEWRAIVANRTKGRGCPFCANKRVSVTNTLAIHARAVAKQWHPTKNFPLAPRDVTIGSSRRIWWKCPLGEDHVWEETVRKRVSGGCGCPYCSGHRPSKTSSLQASAPAYAAEWHPKKNGALTAADVTIGSGRIVWWKCSTNPKHEWTNSVTNRVIHGQGCPFCSRRRIIPETSLSACYPEVAAQWHPTKNGATLPTEVAPHGSYYAWWKCPEGPDHEWQSFVYSRAKEGSCCPFCINQRLSRTNSLASLYPALAREWHPTKNGKLTPKDVVAAGHARWWWRCMFGHVWLTKMHSRTRLGRGCPECRGRRPQRPVSRPKQKGRVLLASYEGARTKR